MKTSSLPKHLSNSLRREIAVRFVQHEMRKLFPHVRNAAQWRVLDNDIEQWFTNLTVRNFWNGVHGLAMGFRLKSLVPWITSKNVQWKKKNMPVEQIRPGTSMKSASSTPRDHDPIFVLYKEKQFHVIDGNRRLHVALAAGKKTIPAYVGVPVRKPYLSEHWVSTSLLVDLVSAYNKTRRTQNFLMP